MADNWADLSRVLGALPDLAGALCVGRSGLFDSPEPGADRELAEYQKARALSLCARCPVLDACTEWLNSLPKSKRPSGIVAGRTRNAPERNIA